MLLEWFMYTPYGFDVISKGVWSSFDMGWIYVFYGWWNVSNIVLDGILYFISSPFLGFQVPCLNFDFSPLMCFSSLVACRDGRLCGVSKDNLRWKNEKKLVV